MSVRFTVLGPVEILAADGSLPVPGALRRGLLALLLLHANEVVGHQQIVEGLWGPTPPATARAQVRAAVGALRGVLRRAGAADLLATRPAGYLLATAPDWLDLTAFRADVQRARQAMVWHDHEEAASELRRALRRWRGGALTGAVGFFVDASRIRLEEQRLAALEDLAAAELSLGRHAELIPTLTELVRHHPLRERMSQHLALALHRSGRTAEALTVVRRLRAVLAEEHGLDPGAEVIAVERAILRGHADVAAATPVVRPAQLPGEPGHFTGRDRELADLDTAGGTTLLVQVVSGPAGIGKTALALTWAHRHRDEYPDGQLFLDLHGHSRASALPVAVALRHLVRGLGVPAEHCPTEAAELAGLFRSLCDGRRILVLLDNAASSEQVAELLPGSATCVVVVTSRRRLEALEASSLVHQLVLGPLRRDDSVRLLRTVAGPRRPEPELAARLAAGCGDFPLALRIAAAQLVNRPAGAAEEIVARLDLTLEDGSLGVLKAFAATYADLRPTAARLFRLLALAPYRQIGTADAVALSGLPAAEVRPALDELVGLHLLLESGGGGRYRSHDLVRSYARARALADEPSADRAGALDRLVDYHLAGTLAANRYVSPERKRVSPDTVAPAGTVLPGNRAEALAWLDAELPHIIAVAGRAAELGRPEAAWQLAYLVSGYCTLRGKYAEQADICRSGMATVAGTGSPVDEAALRQCLGVACLSIRRFDEALEHVERALVIFEETGDEDGISRANNNIGVIRRWQRRFDEALAVYERALARHGAARTDNVAVLLNNIGEVYAEMGDRASAVAYLERALAVRVELGDRYGEGITLLNLGDVLLGHASGEAAAVRFGEAIAALREAGDRYAQATALTQLGEARRRTGAHDEALVLLRDALALRTETGDRHGEAATRTVLAATLLDLGDPGAARTELARARDIRRTHPDPFEPEQPRADLERRLGMHTDSIPDP